MLDGVDSRLHSFTYQGIEVSKKNKKKMVQITDIDLYLFTVLG